MSIVLLREAFKKDEQLHHACLISGEREETVELLRGFIEKDLSLKTKGNPDVHFLDFDSFGVDDGRALQSLASKKSFSSKKIFVASFNSMTLEAQNALLKLFEEPTKHTHFFLVTRNTDQILATLKSRLFLVTDTVGESGVAVERDIAKAFLSLSKAERLQSISKIVAKKDKEAANKFLSDVEAVLHEHLQKTKDHSSFAEGLESVARSKQYLFDRASSLKLLLENVALTVPKI